MENLNEYTKYNTFLPIFPQTRRRPCHDRFTRQYLVKSPLTRCNPLSQVFTAIPPGLLSYDVYEAFTPSSGTGQPFTESTSNVQNKY